MKRRSLVVLLAMPGCDSVFDTGPNWTLMPLLSEVGDHHDVEVIGYVTWADGPGGGTTATAEFYSDDGYETLIDSVDQTIGADIREKGQAQNYNIGSDEVWLLPAIDGYERVCVTFMAEASSYPTFTQLGCLPLGP